MPSYDESLLAKAPKATKAQLQDGYNPDLLVEKTSSTPPASAAATVDPELANRVPTPQSSSAPLTKKKVPFYATKKGIAIIVVLVIAVIIAAVVGGVVGSRKKVSLSSNSGGNGVQGAGQTTTSSHTSSSSPSSGVQSFTSNAGSTSSTIPFPSAAAPTQGSQGSGAS